jgi:hypothetical protein
MVGVLVFVLIVAGLGLLGALAALQGPESRNDFLDPRGPAERLGIV